MRNKVLFGVLSVLVVVAAILVSQHLISSKEAPKKDSAKHNVMFVKTQKVVLEDHEAEMHYRGRVTAYDQISLASEVSGKLLKSDIRFKVGESFKKGDLLVNLYSEDVEASLMSGKSSFLQTLSVILPDLKVDYADEYDKWYSFFNSIDVAKPLPALPETSSNKERIFLASNNVLSNYYTLRQQEINLTRYKIYAPFDGSFTSVSKEIGTVASPSSELATIIRTDKLELTVSLFAHDLKWVKKGDKVMMTDRNGATKEATILRISPFVESQTLSVSVYLGFSPDETINVLTGEYVDVTFTGEPISSISIPREALVDGNKLYQLVDGKLSLVDVDIVRELSDSYLINGLPSEMIVVSESLASVNPNLEYLAR